MASEPPLGPPAGLPLTRRSIFAQAWPIMLGQATIPLVGIVDAAVIGRTGDAAALAGVALGATVISLIFWSFGFLRMGFTGLTAQAEGAGDKAEVEALLLRGLVLGGAIGLVLLVLGGPIGDLAFALLAGEQAVSLEAGGYVEARFLGAPAALAAFAINGWLIGLGQTRAALVIQIVVNCANIALDLLFVWGFSMGARGVGLGTAGAEWIALVTGLFVCARIASGNPFALYRRADRSVLFAPHVLKRLFAVNGDLMIRTIALLFLFTWFANAGARLGATALAANHVLMQFVSIAAFVLDGFAFTAEARVGQAIGARSRETFMRAVRLASEFCLASGAVLALFFFLVGESVVAFIATDPGVRAEAARFLPFAALVPLIGMPSWMLDGVFIGATRGKALRNAAVISTTLYLVTDLVLRPMGNLGVWIAFCCSYAFRAGALALWWPDLMRTLAADEKAA